VVKVRLISKSRVFDNLVQMRNSVPIKEDMSFPSYRYRHASTQSIVNAGEIGGSLLQGQVLGRFPETSTVKRENF
jgi:hypothetical protein